MIIGTGLLARAFSISKLKNKNAIIYAAGVSNSNCIDQSEFDRERYRLSEALQKSSEINTFIYFGTCSVLDPLAIETPYVQHKLAMEKIVHTHQNSLIFRLPQLAGKSPNPHTLLNFLYARISRSEKFKLWGNAKRNIIDVGDVVSIASLIIDECLIRNTTVNIANTVNYKMNDIVETMEQVLSKRAVYDVVENGSEYTIDITDISSVLDDAKVKFDDDYLKDVIAKYYSC